MLPQVIKELTAPALFFLDGHYSGDITARGDKETPVLEELGALLSDGRFEHVVVVDDARCFTGQNDYPTLDHLKTFVAERAPHMGFFRHTDMIALTPSGIPAPFGPVR